jgi:hypothetical protein
MNGTHDQPSHPNDAKIAGKRYFTAEIEMHLSFSQKNWYPKQIGVYRSKKIASGRWAKKTRIFRFKNSCSSSCGWQGG